MSLWNGGKKNAKFSEVVMNESSLIGKSDSSELSLSRFYPIFMPSSRTFSF